MKKFLLILLNLVLLSSFNAYSNPEENVKDCTDSNTFTYDFGLIVRNDEVLTNGNSDYKYVLEHNAYVWFKENYIDKGKGIVIKLTDTDLENEINSCATLWVVIAPYPDVNADVYTDPNFNEPNFLRYLKNHVAKGASLYLSNYATKLLAENNGIGRISDTYRPYDGQSTEWPNTTNDDLDDDWYVCPFIGVKDGYDKIESEEAARYNHWNHPIYTINKKEGIDLSAIAQKSERYHKWKCIPVSQESVLERKNVYCFWNMTDERYPSAKGHGKTDSLALVNFQNATQSIVLGTTEWAEWYNNAAIVEFYPAHSGDGKTVFDGTIIANGLAGCAYGVPKTGQDEWEKNAAQINANALAYLRTKAFQRGELKVKSIADLNWIYTKTSDEIYKDGYWSTFYCDQNKILPENMEAWVVTDVKETTAESDNYKKIKSQVATLKKVAGSRDGVRSEFGKLDILPANHGYLLRTKERHPAEGHSESEEGQLITLENTKVAPTISMDDYTTFYPSGTKNENDNEKTNYLMGSAVAKTFKVTDNASDHVFYILAGERRINTNEWSYGFYIKRDENGDVYKDGAELNNAAHRAFIYAPKPSGSENNAKPLLFSFGTDETTGIENLRTETRAQDGFCYNMAGQRVGKDYKGLVIKNGKKYLVK